MSEAEVDVVRRAGEAYTERGIEGFLEFLNPEVEWRSRADLPDTDLYTGHDGVRRLFARFEEDIADMYYEPEGLIDAGERVILVMKWGGRGRGSGIDVEERGEAWVITVSGGKIVKVDEFAYKQKALEAVESE